MSTLDGEENTHARVSPGVPPLLATDSYLGPYRIVRQIAQGGMGVVYEAIHERLRQRVAIKTLSPKLLNSDKGRERARREALACARLHHDGLVRIHSYEEHEETPYIVMELLEGDLLRQRLQQQGSLEPTVALRLTRQIASALAVAHYQGIVHRDLKPENVMLVPDSEVPGGERTKVIDFGIARFLDTPELGTLSTGSTGVLGTLTYMSPEQCRSSEEVGERSDVYALGVMLYEMLCGRPPFVGDMARIVFLHVQQKPLPPSYIRPELDPALDRLVMHMLEKAPSRRPTMAEVAAALHRPLGRYIRIPGVRLLRRTPRWSRRAAAAITLVALGWTFWNSQFAPPWAWDANPERYDRAVFKMKGARYFWREMQYADTEFWANYYINIFDESGKIDINAYTHNNGLGEAHLVSVVAFYDENDVFLDAVTSPRCGVSRSRKYLGRYDEDHQRHCGSPSYRLMPDLVSKIRFIRIKLFDRNTTDLGEYYRSDEGKREIRAAERLTPQ